MENKVEQKIAAERKRLGECFKCRHHGVIERICRITGCLCKYPHEELREQGLSLGLIKNLQGWLTIQAGFGIL